MRILPALVFGPNSWTLPLADRSAAVLVEELLETSAPASHPADCLTLDPPLMLWVACRAWQIDGLRPRSMQRLTKWLVDQATQVLRWDEDGAENYHGAIFERHQKRFTSQVASDLMIAELAAAQAGQDSEELAAEAKLLGILSGAGTWLQMVAPNADPAALLPDWLVQSESTPAGQCVAQAIRFAGSDAELEASRLDIQARRDWADQNARAWEKTISDTSSLLPALTAKLGRLAALEQNFSETLESEKLASLAEFAAGAGHEINNPLAIIGGRSQLLLRDEECPERQRELALIIAQVRRANEMIADMRLFSRPPEPEPGSFDLTELVNRTTSEFEEQASQRAIELVRTGEIAAVEIEADPVQIGVALHAILRNALEAVGRDGVVEISVRRTPSGVDVSVADDGPGIPPEIRRHIFDPFYSSRQAGRGLGFGLSKAWRIVTNHGGKILVDSEPGEGAVFVISLPRRSPAGS